MDEIPSDCASLIIAAPGKDISTGESGLITEYLRKGGGLLVITSFSNVSFPVLNSVLADFNIEISDNKIREGDVNHRFNNDPYTIRAIAPSGTITPTTVDAFTLVDNVRAINELKNSREWIKVEPVLTTSSQGVIEIRGDSAQSSEQGTQNIGLLCENSGYVDGTTVKQTAKVVVLGSGSIFDDSTIQISQLLYNAYIFYYGLRWLANDTSENLYIAAKTPTSYYITTGTESLRIFTAVFVMLIIPAALLLAALFVYRKRKHM
jgi:ABC-2 type transport system permease protein